MKQKIDELSHNASKIEVSIELFEELRNDPIKLHEEYIINITKLKFLENEIINSCEKMLDITRKKESSVKKYI